VTLDWLADGLLAIFLAAVAWIAWLLWGRKPEWTDAEAWLEVLRLRALGIPFECVSVTKRKGWSGHAILHDAEFMAVQSGSDENKSFFAATPSGSLKVTMVVPDVFEVGKLYYLDISEASA
jgi:hypothetical protein